MKNYISIINLNVSIFLNCLFVFFSLGCSTEPQEESLKIFEEVDGLVAVEAEHYSDQKLTDVREWLLCTSDTQDRDNEGNFSAEASGGKYMEILPDTRRTHDDKLIRGENFSNIPGVMAIIEYPVYFNNPGRYYVWVRCFSIGSEENGVHVGINGIWPESGQRMQWCEGKNTWRWENAQRTDSVHCGEPGLIYLEVPSAGIHTVAFSMREDGFRMDKWLMSSDPDFVRPNDAVPDERLYQGEVDLKPIDHMHSFIAIEDFSNITSGDVPYYIDNARKALAIDASKTENRGVFARAITTFYGTAGSYDLSLTTMAEFDGESTYKVWVNDKEIGTYQNERVTKEEDYKRLQAIFTSVKLAANDKIIVESNAHTNGLIPENDETAWARGRWASLEIRPNDDFQVP